MGDRDYRYRFSATDDASAVLGKIASNAKRDLGKVQDDLDDTGSAGKRMASVLGAVTDDLEDNFRQTEAIAERLGRALGDEGSDDARRFAVALRSAGLSLEDIDQDAEELVAQMQRLEAAAEQSGQGVRRGFDDATDGVKRLGHESDQSRSVMANMAGNTTQELGELGGVAGGAGVAIGQLAEYAADGNIQLKSLVGLVGGLGLVAAVAAGIAGHFKEVAASKAFNRDRINAFATELRESGDAAAVLRKELEETGQVKVELGDFGTGDIAPALAAVGLNLTQFTDLAGQSEEQIHAWAEALRAAGVDAGAVTAIEVGLIDTHGNLADAETQAATTARILGEATGATAQEMQAAKDAGDAYRTALDALNTAQDAALGNNISLAEAMLNTAESLTNYTTVMNDAEASDLDKSRAGLGLISTMQAEAEAAGRSAFDQAVAAGNAAGAQQASSDAQIQALWRLAAQLEPGSYLRNQIVDHINALNQIPTTIQTTVRVNTSYGQGTVPIQSGLAPRARGGPVAAGEGYVVGEEGPELFMPNTSGTIVPAAATGAALAGAAGVAGGVTVVLQLANLNVFSQRIDERSGPQIMDAIEVAIRRSGANQLRRALGLN